MTRKSGEWKSLVNQQSDGCWIWVGSLDKHGYGQYDVRTDGKRKNWRAHRWVYTQLVRPLFADETLDHLCRVHACVNPAHLEPVSHAENVARGNAGLHNRIKTHCPKGHEYTAENTLIRREGGRSCRACNRESTREIMREKRGYLGNPPNNEKTHCAQGHEFTPENTRYPKRGGRACITCQRQKTRDYMRRKREAERLQ